MQRVTITIDEDLVAELERYMAAPDTPIARKRYAIWRDQACSSMQCKPQGDKSHVSQLSFTSTTITNANCRSG